LFIGLILITKPLPLITMPLNALLHHLEAFLPLSENFKNFIKENSIVRSYPDHHILLNVLEVSSHIYYLHDGFVMSYSLNKEGKTTENFWKAGQVVVAFESFFEQRPSFEVLEVVRSSEMVCLSREVLLQTLAEFPEAQMLYSMMLNRSFIQLQRRLGYLKQSDHLIQYTKLLHVFPGLEQIVSQRAIATYLGIAPQTLARIKRKI